MKTKILFVITKATWGGAQRYVFDIATNLPRDTFEPFVVYGAAGRLAHKLAEASVAAKKIPSLDRDVAVISDIRSFFALLREIRHLRPDIVHLNSSKAAALGALAARIAGVPNILFTVHGWPFKERRNFLWRAFVYFVSHLTALLSHTVVVVSETDNRIAMRMRLGPKTRFIPLGLDPSEIAPPEEAYRTMFDSLKPAPLRTGTVRLVSIGEMTPNKGLGTALEAVAALAERGVDTIYVIAGEGEERGELERKAKKLGLEDRVFFPGFVPNASRNLAGFDILLLPSLKEGTPYVLLEAAAAGIPIIASSVVDAALAKALHARIVPPSDSFALADAIAASAKLPRSPIRENPFPLSVMLAKTLALYRPVQETV